MRIFEIETPDGRLLRQSHPSLDHVKNHLLPHYVVRGEVFGADSKGNGGLVDRFDEEPLIVKLLESRNGSFLDEWIVKRMAVHAAAQPQPKHRVEVLVDGEPI